MIRIWNPQGLWLLLIIPLLWVLVRRRATVDVVLVPLFPELETVLKAAPRAAPRPLRLNRRRRFLLTAGSMILLVIAIADVRWVHRAAPSSDWLIVFDNVASSGAEANGEPVLERMRAAVLSYCRGLPPGDRVLLLSTSPAFRSVAVSDADELGSALADFEAEGSVAVKDAVVSLGRMFQPGQFRGRLLVSPRQHRWEEALGAAADAYARPAARAVGSNAGIVELEVRPSVRGAGRFDVCVEVASDQALGLRVEGPGGNLTEATASPGIPWCAEGRVLDEGRWAVAIEQEDAFPLDDRVEFLVSAPPPVTVAFRTAAFPLLRRAILAGDRFRQVEHGADVDVYCGDPPDRVDRPTLVVRPETGFLGNRYRSFTSDPGEFHVLGRHQVTRNAGFWNLRPRTVLSFDYVGEHRVLAEAGDVPVVVATAQEGHRLLVWNFHPAQSGAGGDASFPMLVSDSLDWLVGHRDVTWNRLPGCPGEPPMFNWEAPPVAVAESLLCRAVSADAASLTVPQEPFPARPRPAPVDREVPLAPVALPVAVVLMGLLAAAAVYGDPGE